MFETKTGLFCLCFDGVEIQKDRIKSVGLAKELPLLINVPTCSDVNTEISLNVAFWSSWWGAGFAISDVAFSWYVVQLFSSESFECL